MNRVILEKTKNSSVTNNKTENVKILKHLYKN